MAQQTEQEKTKVCTVSFIGLVIIQAVVLRLWDLETQLLANRKEGFGERQN